MRARTFTGAAVAAATLLFAGTALAEPVTISFLTHWPPETVAKLEAAAEKYKEANPDVSVAVRAVPFGDLLTTLRSQGGGASSSAMASVPGMPPGAGRP